MLAVVTGASRGIGRATAIELSVHHPEWEILGVSRSEVFSGDFSASNFRIIKADITREQDIQSLIMQIQNSGKKISLLIHNAAMLIKKPFPSISLADLEKVYRVNVFAPFVLTQACIPYMQEGAHVVMISSMGGFQGSVKFPGLSAYSSSKAALANLVECLAEEYKDKKIFFNSLHLGAVQTEMLESAFPGYKAPIDAKEMAAFIAWFGKNGHRWFNGKCIPVSCSTP